GASSYSALRAGGGGQGGANSGQAGISGIANTGGGGGCGGFSSGSNASGGSGGSGIAIISYPGTIARASGGTLDTTSRAGYVMHVYTTSGVFAPTNEPLTNLGLYYDASIASSYSGTGSTWTDLSGRGYNGTIDGSYTYNSSNGGSIVFNGSNVRVRIGAATDGFAQTMSISMWVYPIATNSGVLWWDDNSVSGGDSWGWFTSANKFEVTGDYGQLTSNQTIQANQWYNLVFVCQTSSPNKAIYINGVLDNSNTSSISSRNGRSYVTIGHGYDGNSAPVNQYLNARVAKYTIHNRAYCSRNIK
ncbi:MAG: hypothetical protein EBU08_18630, partial [Micrococcales bacterium]|nr:hypothetical protein [Micrococcales bacterium]